MASVNNIEERLKYMESRLYKFNPPGDFIMFIIGVISVDNSKPDLTSNFIGNIRAYRNNGLYPCIDIKSNIIKKYNNELVSTSYLQMGLASNFEFYPVTFTYNGKKYGGFSFYPSTSCLHYIELEGLFTNDFKPFLVSYKNGKTSQILNDEINSSIKKANLSEVDLLNHNGRNVWKQGDKITNAVWNDYAEYFPKGEETEPGDIIALDSNSNKEQYIKADCNSRRVIGVHSDSYGHILGGDKVEDYNKFFEENDKKYIPVGLNGRVYVKIKGPVKIGDYIVPSEEKGIGRALKDGEKSKNIIGYVVEPDNLTEERRVKIFIALGGGK